jgi:hypothetical protein
VGIEYGSESMNTISLRQIRAFIAVGLILITSYALLALNPGLFWDDWVWPTQSSSENILVGRQLGVWWAGYFNNWIYSIQNFSYIFRALAIAGWLLSSAAFCFTLSKLRIVEGGLLYVTFALIAISHATLFRVVNSVAMYSVYLACFWCACAILAHLGRRSRWSWIAVPLFLFSFYLNSLFIMYAAFFGLMFFHQAMPALEKLLLGPSREWRALFRRLCAALACEVRAFFSDRSVWVWALLPVIFYAAKWATSVKSDLYGNYNAVGVDGVFSALTQTLAIFPGAMREYWATLWKNEPREQNFIFIWVAILLVRFFWNGESDLTIKRSFKFLLVGFCIFYFGALPYVAVGKPPSLTDLYDSRHAIVAIPGLAIIFLALCNILILGCVRHPIWNAWLRLASAGALVGLSVSYSVSFGAGLWWDWLRQESFIAKLSHEKEELSGASMVLIRDYSGASIYRGRKIWNYEYTGAVQRVFPEQTLMAVDVEEYGAWGINEAIVSDEKLRHRYNIKNVQISKPHAVLRIDGPKLEYLTSDLIPYLHDRYWGSGSGVLPPQAKFSYKLDWEYVEVAERVRDFAKAKTLLDSYRQHYGHYPMSSPAAEAEAGAVELVYHAARGVKIAPQPSWGGIPGIPTEAWNKVRREMEQSSNGQRGFQYWSDGRDYKLAYVGAPDYAYAKQAFPSFIDPARESYAIWTQGGLSW